MRSNENGTTIRRLYGAFNSRDLDALESLLAPTFVDHTAPPSQPSGPGGYKQSWLLLWSTFKTIQMTPNDILDNNGYAAVYGTFATDVPWHGEGRFITLIQTEGERITDLWNLLAVGQSPTL